jgi:hypothetical protein
VTRKHFNSAKYLSEQYKKVFEPTVTGTDNSQNQDQIESVELVST